ncbi:MAG: site-specific integrase [Candidatus Aenigmatarchaeota archaeon]
MGELLNLKIKDVVFDTYGCYLLVTDKTGWRRVRLIEFSGDLLRWLDQHPKKQDPEAWVWINLERLDDVVSVSRVNSMLKELAKKVGIRKRVNPHSFRHARATHLARHLPEAVMKKFFGWSNDSKMASVYYHLSGRDVDEALLKLNGIEVSRTDSEDKKVKVCQKCGYANSLLSHFCIKCSSPLDYKLIEIDKLAERFDEFLKDFFIYYSEVDPQFKKALVSFVRDKGYEDLFEL